MILHGVIGRMRDLPPFSALEGDQIGCQRHGTRFAVADDHARTVPHPHQGIASPARQSGLAPAFRRNDVDSSVVTGVAVKRDPAAIGRPSRVIVIGRVVVGKPDGIRGIERLDINGEAAFVRPVPTEGDPAAVRRQSRRLLLSFVCGERHRKRNGGMKPLAPQSPGAEGQAQAEDGSGCYTNPTRRRHSQGAPLVR